MSKLLCLIATLLLILPVAASAMRISIGALSSDSDDSTEVIADTLNNVAWFLSNNNHGRDVGYIRQYEGNVIVRFEWANTSDSDLFSRLGHYPGIGWQLYRPRIAVAEPGSFALLALGFGGLTLARRRSKN